MAQGKKGLRWSNLSYAARLTLTFAFVVVVTVVVAFGTLALVLNHNIGADPLFAVGVTAAFGVVLAVLIGFLFSRAMVRPINHIASTARAIQEGDLSARTYLQGEDEVARLGETFDAMADAIEKDRLLERRLTTDVAHELRTPLMAIQATVEAMIDGVYKADEEHLLTVNSEVQRLSRLVDALLRLSRLENRTDPMKEEVLNLGELIGSVVLAHEVLVTDSGLMIHYSAQPNVFVKGDPDMLRQAVANLISNAVRYTPEGGEIWVSVRAGDMMASITVEDTGIGLTRDEAKMVFSRFWRAESGRNRESGGLGVGLAVVKEIVDRHGGWVQVEGEKGVGATFTMHVPIYDERREESLERARVREAQRVAREAQRYARDAQRYAREARQSQRLTRQSQRLERQSQRLNRKK